jgi:hypothetical protein
MPDRFSALSVMGRAPVRVGLSMADQAAVDLASVSEVYHHDQELIVVHGVDHPVVTDADAVGGLQALKRDHAVRSGIVLKAVDRGLDAPTNRLVELTQRPECARVISIR